LSVVFSVDEEDMTDDDGFQDDREIWEVTHVCEQDLETTEGEGVDFLAELLELPGVLLFIIRVNRELKRVYRNGCRYNERLNSETGGSKTPRTHWVARVNI
jgi:hypothetical protein